jgi:hypothetical protein
VEQDKLTTTDGFFFGTSERWNTGEGKQQTIQALIKAEAWMADSMTEVDHRAVYYQASW